VCDGVPELQRDGPGAAVCPQAFRSPVLLARNPRSPIPFSHPPSVPSLSAPQPPPDRHSAAPQPAAAAAAAPHAGGGAGPGAGGLEAAWRRAEADEAGLLHPDTLRPLIQATAPEPHRPTAPLPPPETLPWLGGGRGAAGLREDLGQAGERLSSLLGLLHDGLNGRNRYTLL
jgi:hypothetical protein